MLPQLRELEHEFANELVVIGVHSPKFPAEQLGENLRKAVLRHDLAHPVVNDALHAIWDAYTVRAWPTLMFVDPRGRVIGKHEGEFALAPMREFIRDAIAAFDSEGAIDRAPLPLDSLSEVSGFLRFPGNVLADPAADRLFIADSGNHRIVVAGLDGRIRHIAGDGTAGLTDGLWKRARFRNPQGMAIDPTGRTLFIADTGNHALRSLDLVSSEIRTLAGTGERGHGAEAGPGRGTALASPWDLAWLQGKVWIAMAGTHQLWTYDPETTVVGPAAGSGHESIHDGPLASATFAQPSGLSALDGMLYVADSETSAVRRVDPAHDRVSRLVGRGLFHFGDVDAAGDSARLQHVLGVAATREHGRHAVYIADSYNNKIKRLDPETRAVTTAFGSGEHGLLDGDADSAEFWEPAGLGLAGRTLYVADTNNHAIRIADLDNGTVRTLELIPT